MEREIGERGVPDAAYISGDTDLFEEIALLEGRYNRAILYPSNALHCARIPDDLTLSADTATGRLTVNTFLIGLA